MLFLSLKSLVVVLPRNYVSSRVHSAIHCLPIGLENTSNRSGDKISFDLSANLAKNTKHCELIAVVAHFDDNECLAFVFTWKGRLWSKCHEFRRTIHRRADHPLSPADVIRRPIGAQATPKVPISHRN